MLVDNAACSAAIKDVFNETRSILEPSGALAVAGASAYLQRQGIQVGRVELSSEASQIAFVFTLPATLGLQLVPASLLH